MNLHTSLSDKDLIDRIAHAWIDGGGDAEGIEWTWRDIRDRVKELQDEAEEDES